MASWLESHAISPSLAAAVGVTGVRDGEITFTYGRSFVRVRGSDGITRQPSGERLSLYCPVGNRAAYVLLCEGEGDTLAAASVLCTDEGEPRDDLPAPLAGLMPVGIPGTGTPLRVICGELIAMGAEHVLVCFDGDVAGRNKQRAVLRELARYEIEAAPVHLPDDTDLADNLRAADDRTDWLAHQIADASTLAST